MLAIKISTYGTLMTELALGTLVFYRPLRKWVLLAGIGMHAFIEYAFNIPLFGFTICSFYVAFYEGAEVSEWARRIGGRLRRFRVMVSPPVCWRFRESPRAALEAIDAFGLVDYALGSGSDLSNTSDTSGKPSPSAEKWTARTASGKTLNPCRASLARSPAAWPLALIPGLWKSLLTGAAEPAPSAAAEVSRKARRRAPR